MRPLTSLVLVIALSSAAIPTLADEPKGDLAKLQGRWTSKVGPRNLPAVMTIKNETVETRVTTPDNEEIVLKGTIKLDEKASPKTADLLNFTRPSGQEIPEIQSIYKIEGDEWIVCSASPGNDRPTKFESGEDGPPNLMTWTRVKPDEKAPKDDLARMQGTWTAPAGPNDEVLITLTIKDKGYTAKWDPGDGSSIELKGDIKFDEKLSPKTIDFVNTQRKDGEDARDNFGIYVFEGEKLKICVGGAGNERPKEFKKGDDGEPLLLLFAKKKD